MIILIDNGHGINTPGKCSPDGKYREFAFAREIAGMIRQQLTERGYDARLLVPETADIPLDERARRANEICGRVGSSNVILISIHSNAAGNGGWMKARGWSAFTSRGKTKADELASCLYDAAKKHFPQGTKIRTDFSDGDPDWEENFYVLAKTKCPAVLTENFFHDNHEDVDYISSPEGKKAIALAHVEGIINYIKKQL